MSLTVGTEKVWEIKRMQQFCLFVCFLQIFETRRGRVVVLSLMGYQVEGRKKVLCSATHRLLSFGWFGTDFSVALFSEQSQKPEWQRGPVQFSLSHWDRRQTENPCLDIRTTQLWKKEQTLNTIQLCHWMSWKRDSRLLKINITLPSLENLMEHNHVITFNQLI